MAAFCVCMAPEIAIALQAAVKLRSMRIAFSVALGCMAAWHLFQGPFLSIPRFWFYVVLAALYLGARALFAEAGPHILRQLILYKTIIVLLALTLVAVYLVYLPQFVPGRHGTMPIYRHLRHINYDMTVVIALGIYSWAVVKSRRRFLACGAVFAALGYFSVWSGGRGELLALLVFWVGLVVFRILRVRDRQFWLPLSALLLGGALVLFSGQTRILFDRFEKTVAAESIDRVSSGRIAIWQTSLERVMESPQSLLFGFGPDAFKRLHVIRKWPTGGPVHPHNVLVQWGLEFGLLGTLVLLWMFGKVFARALQCLGRATSLDLPVTVSALLLGLFAYSMVDGLFYHVLPLTMIVMLSAYLMRESPWR